MLKNQLPLTLALALMVSLSFTPGVFALDYTNRLGNKATFETLEETRVSSPAAAAAQGSGKATFKSHPVLDGYPKELRMYTGRRTCGAGAPIAPTRTSWSLPRSPSGTRMPRLHT